MNARFCRYDLDNESPRVAFRWQNLSGFQRGGQSSVSKNPLGDWTANNSDKASTIGLGGVVHVVPDKVDVNDLGRYQKVNGFANLFSPPGGNPDIAVPIPHVDDTKIWTTSLELLYRLTKTIDVSVTFVRRITGSQVRLREVLA